MTGTIGVVVRAVHGGLAPAPATELGRRIDAHGLHLTGDRREGADEPIDKAVDDGR